MSKQPLLSQSATVMIAGFMVLFIAGGSRLAIGLVVKPMADDLHWDRATIGMAIAVFLLVSALGMFIAGRLSDRYNVRDVLILGTIISATSLALLSFVTEPWQMFILYGLFFAIGNGMASLTPVSVLVTQWFPGRTGLANGVAVSGMCLGQLFIVAVLAIVLVEIGWRPVFVWLGAFSLVLLPIILFAIAREQPGRPRSVAGNNGLTLGEAMRTSPFWLLTFAYAICGFQDFFVSTHVVAFAMDRGVGTFLAGNLLALMGITGFVGVIVAGAWSDRSGPAWPFLACFVARFLLFFAIVSIQSETAVILFAVAFGITFWMTAPLTVIFVRDVFGTRHLGTIAGLITMIHHFAGGIGAYVGAKLFDRSGNYDATFWIMIAASILAASLTLAFVRLDRSAAS